MPIIETVGKTKEKLPLPQTIVIRPTMFSCLLMGLLAIMVHELGGLWALINIIQSDTTKSIDILAVVLFLIPSVITSLFLIHLMTLNIEIGSDTLLLRSLMKRRQIKKTADLFKRVLDRDQSKLPVQIDLYPHAGARCLRVRLSIFALEDAQKIVAFAETIRSDGKRPTRDLALVIGIALVALSLLIKQHYSADF